MRRGKNLVLHSRINNIVKKIKLLLLFSGSLNSWSITCTIAKGIWRLNATGKFDSRSNCFRMHCTGKTSSQS